MVLELKADAIIKYRKANKLKSADDLLKIKGFGKGVVANVKAGKKTVACGGEKSVKKVKSKKVTTKKDTSKKETTSSKKSDKKTEEKRVDSKKSESKKSE